MKGLFLNGCKVALTQKFVTASFCFYLYNIHHIIILIIIILFGTMADLWGLGIDFLGAPCCFA